MGSGAYSVVVIVEIAAPPCLEIVNVRTGISLCALWVTHSLCIALLLVLSASWLRWMRSWVERIGRTIAVAVFVVLLAIFAAASCAIRSAIFVAIFFIGVTPGLSISRGTTGTFTVATFASSLSQVVSHLLLTRLFSIRLPYNPTHPNQNPLEHRNTWRAILTRGRELGIDRAVEESLSADTLVDRERWVSEEAFFALDEGAEGFVVGEFTKQNRREEGVDGCGLGCQICVRC